MAVSTPARRSRTLILLRHAKSDWDHPELEDFQRPLAPRGRQAAARIGERLGKTVPGPQIVLCSPASRALQTCTLVTPYLQPFVRVELRPALYMTSPDTMLAEIRTLPDNLACAMLIGHNPGLEQLADTLCGDGDPRDRERLRNRFSTAAYARIAFSAPRWADIAYGRGSLVEFTRPKDLAPAA